MVYTIGSVRIIPRFFGIAGDFQGPYDGRGAAKHVLKISDKSQELVTEESHIVRANGAYLTRLSVDVRPTSDCLQILNFWECEGNSGIVAPVVVCRLAL